jgi:hypothetical protein
LIVFFVFYFLRQGLTEADPPASTSRVLGLQVCITIPGYD